MSHHHPPTEYAVNFEMHDFATRPACIRAALDARRPWIEAKVGVPLKDCCVIETSASLAQIGVEKVLDHASQEPRPSALMRRLRSFVQAAETPEGMPPLVAFSKVPPPLNFFAALKEAARVRPSRLEWQDCPVALYVRSIDAPIVVMNVYYQPGPGSDSDTHTSILIAQRACFDQVVRFLEVMEHRDTLPKLHMQRSEPRAIAHCTWEDLILDDTIVTLLKEDFESFWSKREFFCQRHLPFRRGYLLHGSSGAGKSSAIRAMMCSQNLSAFTLRLFDRSTSDFDLDAVFEDALKERPSIVLLEDLDRAFPRSGEPRTQLSLQHLLNCLDGVATGEGLVVIATGNDPAVLDPAILRRPGRFDRVVHFPNPTAELRARYFTKMEPALDPASIEQAIAESASYSFAQLRESFILAAQFAFRRDDDVTGDDLLHGVRLLRQTMLRGSAPAHAVGFTSELGTNDGRADESSD